MNSEWDRVKELFAACADLEPPARRALLDAATPEVRREVESLLAAEHEASDFLGGPARLGPYQLVEKAGEGGMGTVWKARRADGQFDKQVAVKIIREYSGTEANVERFRAERQILARLEHPNIARLLDGGTTRGGLPYLVMELIDGARIDAYVRERGLGPEDAVTLFLPVCAAVDYANRQGILHRDIKPANILVTAEGAPKLLDFGIAKAIGDSAPPTATVNRVATPAYASPEQLRGQPLTPASDVYSLGVTLQELATGVTPYGSNAHPLPQLPRPLERILSKATHQEPDRRYPTAADLAADLERYLGAIPVHARPDGPIRRAGRFLRERRAAAAVLGVALAASVWWSYRGLRHWDNRLVAVTGVRAKTGDTSLAWLERGVAETLTASLAQTGTFRVVSAGRALGAAQGRTPAQAAQSLGADLYVEGTLSAEASNIRLDLRVLETAGGRAVYARAFQASSAGAAFTLADEAASQIAGHLAAVPPRTPDARVALTQSAEALRSYQQAQALHGQWNLPAAARGFRDAAAADSGFAMAYAGIAQTTGWWDRPGARGAILRASQIAASRPLPKLPSQLIHGLRFYYDARLEESASLLSALASEFPAETDPLFWAGMSYTYAFRLAEARAVFESLTRRDPGHALGWLMLAETSGLDNAIGPARTATARYCALIGNAAPNCAALNGDIHVMSEEWSAAIERYLAAKLVPSAATAAWLGDDPATSLRLAAQAPQTNPQAALAQGNALAASGDLIRAAQEYERSAGLYRNAGLGYLQLLKAAEVWLELGQPGRVLAMTARSANPFAPGISALAHLVRGDKIAAEAEFASLGTALPPIVGAHLAGWTEQFLRMLASSYRGEHPRVVEIAATLPHRFRLLSALPLARSMLELGRLDQAREYLDFAWRSRLNQGGPEIFEEQSGLRVALTSFYQARLAARQGRREDAGRWASSFLTRFTAGSRYLPGLISQAHAIRSGSLR